MAQDIIVYILVFLAGGKVVFNFIKLLIPAKSSIPATCEGCSACKVSKLNKTV